MGKPPLKPAENVPVPASGNIRAVDPSASPHAARTATFYKDPENEEKDDYIEADRREPCNRKARADAIPANA
jgi:hypothetical protein